MEKCICDILNLGDLIDKNGIFNSFLNIDSNYYINIKRLEVTSVPEFKGSYEDINKYFNNVGKLLSISKSENDKAYNAAFKLFNFPEVNELKLGVSRGQKGRGFGKILRKTIISDIKEIIDLGTDDPEIFHLIGLFEDNVGPDRLCDMIARIIYKRIYYYTQRMCKELKITSTIYPYLSFNEDGLFFNPYDKVTLVLFIPKEILHEIPIAKDWEDIDRVCRENEDIRKEINDVIGVSLSKLSSHEKKSYIKKYIFNNPQQLERFLYKYKKTSVKEYDFELDEVGDYIVTKITKELTKHSLLLFSEKPSTSIAIAKSICIKFKDLVENNKASQLLYSDNGKPRGEKIVQRAFYFVADCYCEANNLDVSPESDAGRGPVDFKMSCGNDKTIVEIKLSSNPNVVHGFNTQIEEYAKAEKTENRIFLLIHNGGPQNRIDLVQNLYNNRIREKKSTPELIIIDALPKASASHYNANKKNKVNK